MKLLSQELRIQLSKDGAHTSNEERGRSLISNNSIYKAKYVLCPMVTFARGEERKRGRRVRKSGAGSGSRYDFKQDDREDLGGRWF